jgi:hypothetical protein
MPTIVFDRGMVSEENMELLQCYDQGERTKFSVLTYNQGDRRKNYS